MDTQTKTAIEIPSHAALTTVADFPASAVSQASSSFSEIPPNGAPESQLRTTRNPASHSPSTQTGSKKSTSDMQPPPAKRQRVHNYDRRPRLSICPSVSPDAELVEDRDRNDNTLKGKFEAIFEKYGRDFSNIGDEINVMTGEVIVDHGHILSMHNEKDPGSPSRARPRVSREPTESRSITPMLRGGRSITVGAEDVIATIEAMACRVGTGQTPYLNDEEEDAEDVYDSGEEVGPYRTSSISSDSLLGIGGDDYEDGWESRRSESPDSLVGYEEHDSSTESLYEGHAIVPPITFSTSGSRDEPIILTSGPISAPAPDLEVLDARLAGSHGHPVTASFRPPSPPAFVKSNGKHKIIAKKFNVSKAYEELQKQASLMPAATLPQPDMSEAAISKDKSSRPSERPQPPSRKAKPVGQLQQGASKPTKLGDTRTILKQLPIARPSSESCMRDADYESDDPLQ